MGRLSPLPVPLPSRVEFEKNLLRAFLSGEWPGCEFDGLALWTGDYDVSSLADYEVEEQIEKFVSWRMTAKK